MLGEVAEGGQVIQQAIPAGMGVGGKVVDGAQGEPVPAAGDGFGTRGIVFVFHAGDIGTAGVGLELFRKLSPCNPPKRYLL